MSTPPGGVQNDTKVELTPYLDDIDIVYKPGKGNLNVDPLSRVERLEDVVLGRKEG